MRKKKELKDYKKGTIVNIDSGAVFDQTDGKRISTKGKIVSDLTEEKAQGYENEYNYYYKVKLDDGIIETFNAHELYIK
tara:strand:+ start:1058 stop:1294 length:237 start_codon:yes stop_codon:yes gene_type:complete